MTKYWRTVSASVVGSSHIANNTPCQDASTAQILIKEDGSPLLVAIVADGAGSAVCGGDGAKLTISTIIDFLQKNKNITFTTELAQDIINLIKKKLLEEAIKNNHILRDYACTLIMVLSDTKETLIFQIGDGAAVVDFSNGLELAHIPETGEYVNTTFFLTDDHVDKHILIKIWQNPIKRLAIFSDGLQVFST